MAPKEAMALPPSEVLIMCTGSQGEPMSALTRIAYDDHANVSVQRGDTVIISAKPVPGNELRVHDAIDRLAKSGAEVLHRRSPNDARFRARVLRGDAHASLARGPKALMPIHGEYRMLAAGARLGTRRRECPPRAMVIAENGSVVELTPAGARIIDRMTRASPSSTGSASATSRTLPCGPAPPLRGRRADRGHARWRCRTAAEIAPPELIARGFGQDETLLDEMRDEAQRVAEELAADGITEIKLLQEHMHDAIGQLIYDRTRRRPMILPVVIEV